MRTKLTDTTSSEIAARLVELREEGGAVALGRVLTLIVIADDEELETAVAATNIASREHPCRVIVIAGSDDGADGLDAEIRVGGDAGASEVVIMRPRGETNSCLDSLVMPLLLPDAPTVTWWTSGVPEEPAEHQLGRMSHRRITDVISCNDPVGALRRLATHHQPGDTDLAWARATRWRGLLAAELDDPPYTRVKKVTIEGNPKHPSLALLAAWLRMNLHCEIELVKQPYAPAITGVTLHREDGDTVLDRPAESSVLEIAEPSGIRHRVSLPLRTLADCLMEELRRLDPDEIYGAVLTKGLPQVAEMFS